MKTWEELKAERRKATADKIRQAIAEATPRNWVIIARAYNSDVLHVIDREAIYKDHKEFVTACGRLLTSGESRLHPVFGNAVLCPACAKRYNFENVLARWHEALNERSAGWRQEEEDKQKAAQAESERQAELLRGFLKFYGVEMRADIVVDERRAIIRWKPNPIMDTEYKLSLQLEETK